MIPTLSYTLARLALLALVYAIGYAAGLRDVGLLIAAFLISGAMSFILLNRQRNAMGEGITNFFSRMNAKIELNTRKEDVD